KLISQPKSARSSTTRKNTRLTTGGKIGNATITGGAAISPDGKWVAFRGEEQEKYFLWVEQVSTKTVRPLVQTTEGGFGTSFSADSEFVYYSLFDQGHPKGTLLQIPILGGTPRRILDDIDSAAVFSRDGKRLAFIRLDNATGKSTLMVANADGSDQKEVASRQRPESFPSEGPSWSPDGKRIATGVNKLNSTGTVIEVPVDGGPEKSLTSQKWPHVFRVAWLSDGSGLVVTAYPTEAATGTQLWFIAQPSGDVSQITNDLGGYGSVSLGVTADNNTLVTVQEDWSTQIFAVTPSEATGRATRLTTGKYDGAAGSYVSRDGKIVYGSRTGENIDLWIANADGTDSRPLTTDAFIEFGPGFSPDGRYVVFASNRAGNSNLWRIDADGNNLKQ